MNVKPEAVALLLVVACGPSVSGFDAAVPFDAGAGLVSFDAGVTDAGTRLCSGSGACSGLGENACTAASATDAGCAVRRTFRCVNRGPCAGQTQTACPNAGACRWNGTACVSEACAAEVAEASCLALRCTWANLFAACDGASYDCEAAVASDPSRAAQTCGALRGVGLACTP